MSDYPRDLLIKEDVIREFEEKVGIRFINKTECSKALAEHDAKVRADAIDEFCNEIDLDKPMHFTKEQAAWIKKYVILKRQDAIDDYTEWLRKTHANFDEDYAEDIKSDYLEQLKEG